MERATVEDVRGDFLWPTYNMTVGIVVPFGVAFAIAAFLATVHGYVVDPPEDSKRKKPPKRRNVIMAPSSWRDPTRLYTSPRAFECWLRLGHGGAGGVIVGSASHLDGRAINFEVSNGKPKLMWRAKDFEYEWAADVDVRTGEWTHVVITFNRNTGLDTLLCFVDGREADFATVSEALPSILPDRDMLVGRDHTNDPAKCFDGELSAIRVWSCVLTDEVIASHFDGVDRIYPPLTDEEKDQAENELTERCAARFPRAPASLPLACGGCSPRAPLARLRRLEEAEAMPLMEEHLLHEFHGTWPEQIQLRTAPRSVDAWLRMFPESLGGVVCSSAPSSGAFTFQVMRESGRPRMTWYLRMDDHRADPHLPPQPGRPMFDLTLSRDVRRSEWAHVAFVYSEERDVLLGYVNGNAAGEARRLLKAGSDPPKPAEGPTFYGQDGMEVGPDGARWFDGELSRVRLWSSELHPQAIAKHAGGEDVHAALTLSSDDVALAAEQAQQRLRRLDELVEKARDEEDAELGRRREERRRSRGRNEDIIRQAKREAADAQVKVTAFMSNRRVEFHGARTPLRWGPPRRRFTSEPRGRRPRPLWRPRRARRGLEHLPSRPQGG